MSIPSGGRKAGPAEPAPLRSGVISILGVTHHFGSRTVLKDIDLELTGMRTAVIGGNGSGKSTLARLLNGLVVPEHGRVLVDGLDTRTQSRAVRRKVGFVFQDPDAQIVLPTVAEDVAFGLQLRKIPPALAAARVDAVLDRYGLAELRDHPAHLLSGGQKQMLAIASVLVMDPDYVVLDEPLTLLDLQNKRLVTRSILEMSKPVILVSHDLDLLERFDRVVVMEAGRVVADGPPQESIPLYVRLMAG